MSFVPCPSFGSRVALPWAGFGIRWAAGQNDLKCFVLVILSGLFGYVWIFLDIFLHGFSFCVVLLLK